MRDGEILKVSLQKPKIDAAANHPLEPNGLQSCCSIGANEASDSPQLRGRSRLVGSQIFGNDMLSRCGTQSGDRHAVDIRSGQPASDEAACFVEVRKGRQNMGPRPYVHELRDKADEETEQKEIS